MQSWAGGFICTIGVPSSSALRSEAWFLSVFTVLHPSGILHLQLLFLAFLERFGVTLSKWHAFCLSQPLSVITVGKPPGLLHAFPLPSGLFCHLGLFQLLVEKTRFQWALAVKSMYLGASVFRYVKLDHMYEGQLYMTEMKILEYLSLFFKMFIWLHKVFTTGGPSQLWCVGSTSLTWVEPRAPDWQHSLSHPTTRQVAKEWKT